MYETSLSGCSHRVNLTKSTCTCRKWDICGIPCEHAYGVILHKKLKVEDDVCHWFWTPMWKKNYTEGLVTQRGRAFWPSTTLPNVHVPPEPLQLTRKKGKETNKDKKRNKGKNEFLLKKAPQQLKRIMHYSICGIAGHNSMFHSMKKSSTLVSVSQSLFTSKLLLTVGS